MSGGKRSLPEDVRSKERLGDTGRDLISACKAATTKESHRTISLHVHAPADGMMPAYFIALNRGVSDRRTLEEYWNAAGPTFQGYGAKPLAIYTPLTLLETLGRPLEGAVLVEFPDLATAKSWYESPAYQKAKEIRIGAADAEIFFIDGGVTPAKDRMPQLGGVSP